MHCHIHRPGTTFLHPDLSRAAASIFLQLYLNRAVPISHSRSLFLVFLHFRLLLWPRGIRCTACMTMLSSILRGVCPVQADSISYLSSAAVLASGPFLSISRRC